VTHITGKVFNFVIYLFIHLYSPTRYSLQFLWSSVVRLYCTLFCEDPENFITAVYLLTVVIKMDLQEVGGGCGDWMELAQDRDRWRALVSTVMNLRIPKMRGIS